MKKLTHRIFQLVLILISITAIVLVVLSTILNTSNFNNQFFYDHKNIILKREINLQDKQPSLFQRVECIIKGENSKTFPCLKQSNNSIIYLPFDFIRKKFDVHGKEDENGNLKIEYTDSRIYLPIKNYDSNQEYLWFDNINVESRDRVKYISLRHSVPISWQWIKSGHLYPVQIAQFGLSHFSKWSSLDTKSKLFYSQKFLVNNQNKFIYNDNENAYVNSFENGFQFSFPNKAIYKTNYSFDIRYIKAFVQTNTFFELSIDLMLRDALLQSGSHIVRLVYSFNSTSSTKNESLTQLLNKDKSYTIFYNLNGFKQNESILFIRNICLDACKGLKLKCDNCLKSLNETMVLNNGSINPHRFISQYFKVYQIWLRGEGKIINATLAENVSSFELSKIAADYFVNNQNKLTGGWPINITRKFDSKSKIYLKPGWNSAMAQGHAISLLCRVYSETKDEIYFNSAARALDLFEISSEANGIKANFMNTSLIWFEEYPTQPYSLFVLNGFIYSIYGLNDFLNGCLVSSNLKNSSLEIKAKKLFIDSLKSLTSLINLYDTGTRTFYDLRHLSDATLNPNLARWDYHTLHISQLFYLSNILEHLDNRFDHNLMLNYSVILKTVAQRWLDYTNGLWFQNSQIKDNL